eukprot:6985957-Heterocapsa_arctica.AAC.1
MPRPTDLILAQAAPFDAGTAAAETLRTSLLGCESRRAIRAHPAIMCVLHGLSTADHWVSEFSNALLS